MGKDSNTQNFECNGYLCLPGLFESRELRPVLAVVEDFHEKWQMENQDFYRTRAINSAYLTSNHYLSESQRLTLFQFIAHQKVKTALAPLFSNTPAFMNTQLFFDPVNPALNNYWHRDSQYDLTLAQQEAALGHDRVLHLRVALTDEPGIELIPGTHTRWDCEEELDVRLERNGKRNHHALETGITFPLKAGDALVFSAHMIHRGHYGQDRRVLDILYCDNKPELLKYRSTSCLPTQDMLAKMDWPEPFDTESI